MFFRQVLHEDLGCASYVVADGGEAAVVDPKWEIEEYLDLAREHDFQIRHVLETHNHADHLSARGRRGGRRGYGSRARAGSGSRARARGRGTPRSPTSGRRPPLRHRRRPRTRRSRDPRAAPAGRTSRRVDRAPRADEGARVLGRRGRRPAARWPRSRACARARRAPSAAGRPVRGPRARLGQRLVAVEELAADADEAPAARLDRRPDEELRVDRHRMAVADEDPRRHRREPVPRGEEPAGFVEDGRDEAAVDDSTPALMRLVEMEVRLVELASLHLGRRQPEPEGRVAAAPAGGVVVRRGLPPAHRKPPRSWWGRQKFSEPAVAIAAEADSSRARVAAATIWAKR